MRRGLLVDRGLLVLLLLLAGACSDDQPAADAAALGAEAERALRTFDDGLLEVARFQVTGAQRALAIDNFGHETRLVVLSFESAVALRRALDVPTEDAALARLAAPGGTLKAAEHEVRLARLLGPGPRAAGASANLSAAAVFEWMAPGWRFVAIDRRPHFGPDVKVEELRAR